MSDVAREDCAVQEAGPYDADAATSRCPRGLEEATEERPFQTGISMRVFRVHLHDGCLLVVIQGNELLLELGLQAQQYVLVENDSLRPPRGLVRWGGRPDP